MDTYNLARERSVAPIDVPQMFSGSAAYELPFGPGKPWLSSGGALGRIVGGKPVQATVRLQDARPGDYTGVDPWTCREAAIIHSIATK